MAEEITSSFLSLAEETTRLASIQLASAPEEMTSSFAGLRAPYPPPQSYRESIRSVALPEWRIKSALSCQSGQSGSNYSSISDASSSYLSNISSGCSSGTAELGAEELTKIAYRMISDGYTQRMFQAFIHGGEQDGELETWFAELDINWVFQIRKKYREIWEYQLDDISPLHLKELLKSWIRALTVIIVSIKELVAAVHELAVARFGKASISAMLVFIEAIGRFPKTEFVTVMVQAYICICNASRDMLMIQVISSDAQRIFNEIGGLLERKEDMLIGSMSGFKYPWRSEITARGGVHKNTQWTMDCILLMSEALTSTQNSALSQNNGKLRGLIQDMINNLKTQLLKKSMLCSDPILRYLFLLNNSYFLLQVSEPSVSLDLVVGSGHLKFTPECKKYMDTYLDVSWGRVLSCIPKSNPGPLRRWINTSPLAKFQSAFHQRYQTQKFWEVPDPQLRSLLRETITKKVIPSYRDYLKEHPELEKHASSGSNSPEVMEEMLGELFEG